MTRTRRPLLHLAIATTLCGVALAATAPASLAEKGQQVAFSAQSKIWLEGDSTLHAYKSAAKQWQATLTVAPGSGNQLKFSDLEVVIPVRNLKSGDGALDENLYKALEASRFPTIRFTANAGNLTRSGAAEVQVRGKLAIHGVERDTTVTATGSVTGGTFKLKGKKELLMSDFGVKPPVLLGGMIKCSDRIVVHYDLTGELPE